MLFSKYFRKDKDLDENLERNLLFAPTYLLKEYNLSNGRQLVFGGHSVVTVEKLKSGKKGLFFLRTRGSKSNKLEDPNGTGLMLGFYSLNSKNFLILGTRKNLVSAKSEDRLILNFKDNSKLEFVLQPGNSENPENLKSYSCNFKTQLTTEEISRFMNNGLESFELLSSHNDRIATGNFAVEFSRKFREVAQTYKFCLDQYYQKPL